MANEGRIPTDDVLLAFDQGLLPEDEIDAVSRWLESHPEGEARLQALTSGRPDPAAEALRRPSPLADFEGVGDLSRTIAARVLQGGRAERAPAPSSPAADAMPAAIREYRLLRPLGEGGMGRVYLARHTRLQRDVAIKILPAELAADPWYRGRFEREMAVIGSLDHPNLVRAHDAGLEGPRLFLVMELLQGKDLGCLLREGPLPLAEACELARQAALSLQYAHEHGIVHRDVKPGNLFLTDAGVVKLIDLGLARVHERATGGHASTGRFVMGTPNYLAPEQWDSTAVDPRADVYALGCVLYEMLTGRPPFGDYAQGSLSALMLAHQTKRPRALTAYRPEVPAALADLIERVLGKVPQQRPAARDVAEGLAAFAAGHDLRALLQPGGAGRTLAIRPAAVATARKKPGHRSEWVAAGLTGLLAVAAAWVVLSKDKDRPEPEIVPQGPGVTSKVEGEGTKPHAASVDRDREAAKWAVSLGGVVRVDDEGWDCKAAANLPKGRFTLTWADLTKTGVTDAGMVHLEGLEGLKELFLADTPVTDVGLRSLQDLTGLTLLSLDGTQVAGPGLAQLRGLQRLRRLSLVNTAVADAGLAHLVKLQGLTYLNLRGTKVSAKGLAEFHAGVPGCRIDHTGGTIRPKQGLP